MAASELNTLLERVEAIASTAEEETRKNVINTLRHTAVELEAPGDSFQRIIYLVIKAPESLFFWKVNVNVCSDLSLK